MTNDDPNRLLPMRAMVKRYGVSDRTIDRWLSEGALPEPLRIQKNRYWRVSDLEAFERQHMGSGPVRKTPRHTTAQGG